MAEKSILLKNAAASVVLAVVLCSLSGCSAPASRYWGKVSPPADNVLRYITGSEPESLDPAFGGQPEARIFIGLYDRLVEFDPRTMEPIPSMATHWELDDSGTAYTFYLRKDGRFSNGDPITAGDFVWSFRRLADPVTASRYGYFLYDIKYAEAFNSGSVFVRKGGRFLTIDGGGAYKCENAGPECVTVPADPSERSKIGTALSGELEDAEFVPVRSSDVAAEAVDDFTLRVHLRRPAPYFISLLATQYFAVLHRPTIEKYGGAWTRPENIVTSGAFKVGSWKPYDELFLVRNPYYWDAANVHLAGIRFFPAEEFSTMMNLYKAGIVDATYNHTVPAAWFEQVSRFRDEYMGHPEMSIMYYSFSVRKPPVDKVEVRSALSLAVDRTALSKFLKTTAPLVSFTPEGIFPEYEKVRDRVFERLRKKEGVSDEEWNTREFSPDLACSLMADAGYRVEKRPDGRCQVKDFPAGEMTITYNTLDLHKRVAEFVQAQWKQNLGLEVQIENLEWRTYLEYSAKVEYRGAVRAGWVGDYIDPFAFLLVWYTERNDSRSGWSSPEYDRLVERANAEREQVKRYELLAEAEFLMLRDQPVMPLATNRTNWIKKPYVKGMYPNPGTMHPWKFVYIERDPGNWDRNVDTILNDGGDPNVESEVRALKRTQIEFESSVPGAETGDGN